jgi:uncharacterized protein (DUF2252 family)
MTIAHDLGSRPRSRADGAVRRGSALVDVGVFASLERRLVFDLNDLGETLRGPWERDIKRPGRHMLIAARDNGYAAMDQERVALDTFGE